MELVDCISSSFSSTITEFNTSQSILGLINTTSVTTLCSGSESSSKSSIKLADSSKSLSLGLSSEISCVFEGSDAIMTWRGLFSTSFAARSSSSFFTSLRMLIGDSAGGSRFRLLSNSFFFASLSAAMVSFKSSRLPHSFFKVFCSIWNSTTLFVNGDGGAISFVDSLSSSSSTNSICCSSASILSSDVSFLAPFATLSLTSKLGSLTKLVSWFLIRAFSKSMSSWSNLGLGMVVFNLKLSSMTFKISAASKSSMSSSLSFSLASGLEAEIDTIVVLRFKSASERWWEALRLRLTTSVE